MSDKKWYEGGMYTKTPKRGPCKDTEVFYGRVWVSGRRKRIDFWLGPGFLQAKKRLHAICADPDKALAERERRHVQAFTFGKILDLFLAKYQSRGGTAYYASITKASREFFGERPVTEITAESLDRFLQSRRSERTVGVPRKIDGRVVMVGGGRQRIGASTLRKEIIALGTVFRWAERRGLAARNPVARYEKPQEPGDRTIAVLEPDQEAKLLAELSPWARDVVEWALYSGMRRGEVLALLWRDVDRAQGVVRVLGTKTGQARTVPLGLSTRLGAILDRHPRRTNTDLVFREQDGGQLDVDRLNAFLEAAAKAAGIPKARGVLWNRLRHTWATRLAASGRASIFEIAKWMGNSAAICERHYAAYTPGALERIAGVLDLPGASAEGPSGGLNDRRGELRAGLAFPRSGSGF